LANLGVVAVEEEEVDGEAVAVAEEETGSSSIDGGGGDRQSREQRRFKEFWDEKQNDTGRTTIYRFKNISSGSLTTTAADSFEIRMEAVLI
jgi:hypothetical protein